MRRDFEANSPILTVEETVRQHDVGRPRDDHEPVAAVRAGRLAVHDRWKVQAIATDTPGASTLSLRGLGANRNLVLIDGRRAMPVNALGGGQHQHDSVAPPIARVETITGGASSVYGADAMAGVVNFITKKDFEGVDFDVG